MHPTGTLSKTCADRKYIYLHKCLISSGITGQKYFFMPAISSQSSQAYESPRLDNDLHCHLMRLLCAEFGERVPFTSEQLAVHRACIALRKQAGNVRAAVGDESFVRALHATLRAWGIGIRGFPAGGRLRWRQHARLG
jgi:hypothetical protein